jgi:hypothetical protein
MTVKLIVTKTITDDEGMRRVLLSYDAHVFPNSKVEDAARKLLGWYHRGDHIVKMVARPAQNAIVFDLHFCCGYPSVSQYISFS